MLISPTNIAPSQDFLKEKTVRFILACLRDGKVEDLPPTPLVRKDAEGNLVAIDGHNLIAVRQFRGEGVEVVIAESATDGLPPTTEANITRNQELAAKYASVLEDRQKVAAAGIVTFADLVARNPQLFASATMPSMKTIRQDYTIHAPVSAVYKALTDGPAAEAWGAAPATVDAREGGAFSYWGGDIHGTYTKLVENQLIEQDWYGHDNPDWKYTARFELEGDDAETTVHLSFAGNVLDEQKDIGDWRDYYFEPIKKLLER